MMAFSGTAKINLVPHHHRVFFLSPCCETSRAAPNYVAQHSGLRRADMAFQASGKALWHRLVLPCLVSTLHPCPLSRCQHVAAFSAFRAFLCLCDLSHSLHSTRQYFVSHHALEEAKYFVCAGKREGSKYECSVESCSKRSGPCEHYAATSETTGRRNVKTLFDDNAVAEMLEFITKTGLGKRPVGTPNEADSWDIERLDRNGD